MLRPLLKREAKRVPMTTSEIVSRLTHKTNPAVITKISNWKLIAAQATSGKSRSGSVRRGKLHAEHADD